MFKYSKYTILHVDYSIIKYYKTNISLQNKQTF